MRLSLAFGYVARLRVGWVLLDSMNRIRSWAMAGLEPLLWAVVVVGPWLFGSTRGWTEVVLTALGCLTGCVALVARSDPAWRMRAGGSWRLGFAGAWIVFLLYVLVSVWNGASTAVVSLGGVSLEYHEPIPWLPRSHDVPITTWALMKHLAGAGVFLAVWRLADAEMQGGDSVRSGGGFPAWVVRLIWVLSVSSALLAAVSIAQKLSGTDRLLFLVPRVLPTGGVEARSSLGPFSYQANGAQYFNLVWPVILGFWWCQHRRILHQTGVRPRFGSSPLSLLPLFAALTMACPFVSGSRGGALVCMAQLVILLFWLLLTAHGVPRLMRWGVLAAALLALPIAAAGGWSALWTRFESIDQSYLGRQEIYAQARRMALDFEPWGAGADAFRNLSDLYTDRSKRLWQVWVHNDWLEARVSYGRNGLLLLGVIGLLWLVGWLKGPWLVTARSFSFFLMLSLGGMALHAAYDFPFQILSLWTLFLVWAAILWITLPPWVSGRSGSKRRL